VIPYPAEPLVEDRVELRPWLASDLRLVEEAVQDAALLPGTTLPRTYSDAEGLAFIERQQRRQETGEGISLCITFEGHAVGCATLIGRRPRVADLGYWLVDRARGAGIGTLAVKLLVEWALGLHSLDAVEAFVAEDNVPSRRLLEGLGFRDMGVRTHRVNDFEGVLRAYRRDTT
jgi:RimJ/RimL family protein N-acetyltransferase